MNMIGHNNVQILQHPTVNWPESYTTCVAA